MHYSHISYAAFAYQFITRILGASSFKDIQRMTDKKLC